MDRARFELMFPRDVAEGTRVVVVGCGGIGSYTAPVLARLGVGALRLVDFDRVEATNVATQNLAVATVGEAKVEAVARECRGVRDDLFTVETVDRKVREEDLSPGWMVVSAVDSMEVRRGIWKMFKEQARPGQVLVDPRMGAESFEMWVVRRGGQLEEQYERDVMDETPREALACGARAIAYTGAFAGAMVGSAVRRAAMDEAWEIWMAGDVGTMRTRVLDEKGGE